MSQQRSSFQPYQNTHLSRYDARAWGCVNAASGIYRFCRCRSGVAGRGARAAVGDIQKENDSFSSVGASTSSREAFSNIGSIIISVEWPRYLALIVLLLLVVFGYCRGRSHSLAWTNIPLIALAILSIGPSVCAVILYSAYKSGLIQPSAPGYRFGSFVYSLPVDFALLNWAFVPLYVVGRFGRILAQPGLRCGLLSLRCQSQM